MKLHPVPIIISITSSSLSLLVIGGGGGKGLLPKQLLLGNLNQPVNQRLLTMNTDGSDSGIHIHCSACRGKSRTETESAQCQRCCATLKGLLGCERLVAHACRRFSNSWRKQLQKSRGIHVADCQGLIQEWSTGFCKEMVKANTVTDQVVRGRD